MKIFTLKTPRKLRYRPPQSPTRSVFLGVISALVGCSLFSSALVSAAAELTGSGSVDANNSYTGSSGIRRDYVVYVPESYEEGNQPAAMIMALHGCVMTNIDALDAWNLDLIADQHNVILVFPFVGQFKETRSEKCWGYWFPKHVQEGGGGEVDDIYAIAQEVEANYQIDSERRFITGVSSGAAMAVAEAIAHNEYWSAAASVAGLPYGDWSSSVTAEIFQSLDTHVNKIQAELDYDRAVPMLLVASSNDTTVLPKAMHLTRDSQLTVWADDLVQDGSDQSCSKGGVNCVLKDYNDADGALIVRTMYYNGGPGRDAQYGKGHYWTGGDDDMTVWSDDSDGPNASEQMWSFFDEVAGGGYDPKCETDFTAPAAPTGLALSNIVNTTATLTLNANGEADVRGYRIYRQNSAELTSSPVSSTTITLNGLAANTDYIVNATAVDKCGNESAASAAASFSTADAKPYIPGITDSLLNHYLKGRLSVTEYNAIGLSEGFMISFTMWEVDGSWTRDDPNVGGGGGGGGDDDDDDGGGGGGGGGCGDGECPPGEWTRSANLDGMEVHTYLPSTSTSNGKRALMISLHGCAQANEIVKENWSWTDEADEYGMVIAAPMAPDGGVIASCWDYYGSNHSGTNPARHDDNLIDLANSLITNSSLNIDPDQVYISGLSSGASEAFVMGCMAPQIFAGVGIDAGPSLGTSSGQIGSVPIGTTPSSVANLCRGFSTNEDTFSTQITSVVHGLSYGGASDGLVAVDYARINAEALALVYGVGKDNGSSPISGGGTEETWSDSDGVRISKIMVASLGHAWPASSDSSGGGQYTDHGTIDYPAFLTKFLFDNNRRVVAGEPDSDGDGVPDSSDNCPNDANTNQADNDNDGLGNVCDDTPDGPDSDGDGIPDSLDNCPLGYNPDQADSDNDGLGDVCDSNDADNDGVEDSIDNCPYIANADQADDDGDGIGNVCDSGDATDSDNDGIADSIDNCPSVANNNQLDSDGDGIGDACDNDVVDTDNDGIEDSLDNCPNVANSDQANADGDAEGDACDSTPNGPDADDDGVPDAIDNCPNTANTNQADSDGDGVGNACEPADTCEDITTFNYYHKTGGRATSSGSFWSPAYIANGSGGSMAGSTWGNTTLRSTNGSYWEVGACQ